jgi:hypothetical protein
VFAKLADFSVRAGRVAARSPLPISEPRIAFACESRPTGLSGILIMDADGGNVHPLFSSNSDNDDFAPHFTPDGTENLLRRLPSFVKDEGSGGAPGHGGGPARK